MRARNVHAARVALPPQVVSLAQLLRACQQQQQQDDARHTAALVVLARMVQQQPAAARRQATRAPPSEQPDSQTSGIEEDGAISRSGSGRGSTCSSGSSHDGACSLRATLPKGADSAASDRQPPSTEGADSTPQAPQLQVPKDVAQAAEPRPTRQLLAHAHVAVQCSLPSPPAAARHAAPPVSPAVHHDAGTPCAALAVDTASAHGNGPAPLSGQRHPTEPDAIALAGRLARQWAAAQEQHHQPGVFAPHSSHQATASGSMQHPQQHWPALEGLAARIAALETCQVQHAPPHWPLNKHMHQTMPPLPIQVAPCSSTQHSRGRACMRHRLLPQPPAWCEPSLRDHVRQVRSAVEGLSLDMAAARTALLAARPAVARLPQSIAACTGGAMCSSGGDVVLLPAEGAAARAAAAAGVKQWDAALRRGLPPKGRDAAVTGSTGEMLRDQLSPREAIEVLGLLQELYGNSDC